MKITANENKNDISRIIKSPLRLEIYPDSQILRKVACPVEVFDNDIQLLTDMMLDFMRRNKGVGLAAPQIGLSCRIIVIELDNQSYCMVNPEISLSSEWDIIEEGCLSIPGKTVKVKRQKAAQIQGQDVTGRIQSLVAVGLLARVFQHEIDHLNGVLICDHET